MTSEATPEKLPEARPASAPRFWMTGKKKKTQNPDALAGVPHVQLVWTHLPTLDGVNNWAANFRGHFHIREKSHAECKGGSEGGGFKKKKCGAWKHRNMETC